MNLNSIMYDKLNQSTKAGVRYNTFMVNFFLSLFSPFQYCSCDVCIHCDTKENRCNTPELTYIKITLKEY